MLYHLVKYLSQYYDFPGVWLFQFISFRAGVAAFLALIIALFVGKPIIKWLKKHQIGEQIRQEGPKHHASKKGTPTMGGVIIFIAILIPSLLFADLTNAYVFTMLLAILWVTALGLWDDYIKVFKKDKGGLRGKTKLLAQTGLGVIVGFMMVTHPHFSGRSPRIDPETRVIDPTLLLRRLGFQRGDKLLKAENQTQLNFEQLNQNPYPFASYTILRKGDTITLTIPPQQRKAAAIALFGQKIPGFTTRTDIPFVKDHLFDYSKIIFWSDSPESWWVKLFYVFIVIFIVVAVSNSVNLTDGLDGLAVGTSAIAGGALGIFAYVSGHYVFANYLRVSFIPLSGELSILLAAFVGACIGFLWYNAYPAQVFMGDTGSLMLGGIIGVSALMVKKELLLPVLCGIFFVEALSVIIQVTYFKYTKRKYGEGKRIFLMAPLHHHYELKGMHEAKIVIRFWIVAFLLALIAFLTLKIR